MIERIDFVQAGAAASDWAEVSSIVDDLVAELESPTIADRINDANRPGQSSSAVQDAFLDPAIALGFRSEKKGIFASYSTSALRPDYFRPTRSSGILLEVERGKTTINNMDVLDFWKCHICEHASFLFLMVPSELRQNDGGSVRREFNTVAKRLESFFVPENYTNVLGLVLIGY